MYSRFLFILMKLLSFILFFCISIFGLNYIFKTFYLGVVLELLSIITLYLSFLFIGVNFIKNDFVNVFNFSFALNFSLLFWGLTAMVGIRLIGIATDGILLELDSEYQVELEQISLKLEQDDIIEDPEYLKWLSMLIAPGASLGGARPKASIVGKDGSLWILNFQVEMTKEI